MAIVRTAIAANDGNPTKKGGVSMATTRNNYVRVELSEATIARLLARGELCAADFRCPDGRAKRCLWRLVLESCRVESHYQGCAPRRI